VLDFVLVAPLVAVLALAVVQLALALHVRATLAAAAAEGARSAAAWGAAPRDGVTRARELVNDNLAGDVVTAMSARYERRLGLPVVTVRIDGRVPMIGLLGPQGLTVEGSALREPGVGR
jgi:hypothetical protein